MFDDNYCFLGKNYRLSSDSKEFQRELRNIYRHFRLFKVKGEFENLSFSFFDKSSPNREIGLNWKNSFYHFNKSSPKQIALALPSLLALGLTRYYLFHAGVVSYKGEGILICAYSALGKTTLILELLKRGFSLLSDELAPISYSTHLLEPFPRSLHISRDTLKLFPEVRFQPKKRKEDLKGKILLDIKELPWGKLGKRCFPRYVIFLIPPGGEKEKKHFIELAVGYLTPGFLEKLRGLEGIKEVQKISGKNFPLLRLQVKVGLKLLPDIKRVCQNAQVPMIYAHRGKTETINWLASPRLETISAGSGVLRFAQMLFISSKEALLKNKFSDNKGRLLTEIARFSKGIYFYQMVPGEIREMGELVENLVNPVRKDVLPRPFY